MISHDIQRSPDRIGSRRHLLSAQLFAASTIALVLSCAGPAPPPGGPSDTTPPTVLHTYPDTNEVRVRPERIILEFSEYVDKRTAEESIFISPYVGDLLFDWSGTELTVTFTEPLQDDLTYVVTVGTDVVDIRGQNRMAAGFTLAFSTGDSIDRDQIEGRVFDEKPEGVMIFAYALRRHDPDTLNPSGTRPDYLTQTGKNGQFKLSNLAHGLYRVMAIRDEYRNLVYERDIDQYGVYPEDLAVSSVDPSLTGIFFQLSREDSSHPFVSSASATDRNNLAVRISEPIDSISFLDATVTVADSLTGQAVRVAERYLDRKTSSLIGIVTADPLETGKWYRVLVHGIRDRAGNPIDTMNNRAMVAGVETPDTTRPVISVVGLTNNFQGFPLEHPVDLEFSEPVIREPIGHAATLSDTSGMSVQAHASWLSPTVYRLTPVRQFATREWYVVRVSLDSVSDFQGNRWRDSTMELKFQALDLRTTGVITGQVVDQRPGFRPGPVIVTAIGVGQQTVGPAALSVSGESFSFDQIVEGRYRLSAYMDSDSSGSYSYGLPYPFVPSERFTVYPDTVKVRARWSVENVRMLLR